MSTTSITEVLASQSHRVNSLRSNGYRTVAESVDSTQLPDWLKPYAQNSLWEKRLLGLIEQGFEKEIRFFIEMYMTDKVKDKFRYFNKSWSRKRITDTVEGIRKKIAELPVVEEVMKRLKVTADQVYAVRGIVRRWGDGCLRYAVKAQEEGRDKFKYFCWLTSVKGQEVMNASM